MAGQRKVVDCDIDSAAFERALKNAVEGLVVTSEEEAMKTAYKIRNATTRFTPVDTGLLKGTWFVGDGHDENGWFAEVVNYTSYAADIEFGTENMAAQPMIRPAIAEVLGVQGLRVKIVPTSTRSTP